MDKLCSDLYGDNFEHLYTLMLHQVGLALLSGFVVGLITVFVGVMWFVKFDSVQVTQEGKINGIT